MIGWTEISDHTYSKSTCGANKSTSCAKNGITNACSTADCNQLLTIAPDVILDMHQMMWLSTADFPKILPRLPQDFPEISPRFPRNFPAFSPNFLQVVTKYSPLSIIWQLLSWTHHLSAVRAWKWKWSNGVEESETDLFWCISMTNNVKSCKKINGRVQISDSVFLQ